MSNCCVPPAWCNPPDFAVLFPDLIGPTGPAGAPMASALNVSGLRAISVASITDNGLAEILGYYQPGDMGGGLFLYSASSTATDNGGTVIQPTIGSGRWLRMTDGAPLSVRWFGARGNSASDDSSAFSAAITAAISDAGSVFIPFGHYLFASSVAVSGAVTIFGENVLAATTTLLAASSLNAPIFEVTGECSFRDLSFIGTLDASKTGQCAIRITTTNNVAARGCFFLNFYDHIVIVGTCFYTVFQECSWNTAINSWINASSVTAQGFDLRIEGCRGSTTNATQTYGVFFDGLGSMIMADCQFSPGFATAAAIYVNSLASLAGVQLLSNTVFETSSGGTPAIFLKGSSGTPCKFFQFSNCYIAGGGATAATPAVYFDYADAIFFSNCYFTGNGQAVNTGHRSTNIYFQSCNFQVNDVPIGANFISMGSVISSVSYSFSDCHYTGAFSFVYLPNLSAGQVGYVNVSGGNVGSNATPISLSSGSILQNVRVFGQTANPIVNTVVLTGTLDGSGNAVVAHGINGGNSRTLVAAAWYKGGSAEAIPCVVNYVDGTNVSISAAGHPSVNYRISLSYVQNTFAW